MIAWTPELSVGVKEIDEQHKIFIDIINEMHVAAETQTERPVVGAVLLKLFGYANYHFSTEEKYFALFHYEGAAEHMASHRVFLDRITDLRRRHENHGEDVALETADFMYGWLVNHIQHMDREYIKNFHEHGLV